MVIVLFLEHAKILIVQRVDSRIHHGLGRFESWLWIDLLAYLIESIANSSLFDQFHIAYCVSYLTRSDLAFSSELRLKQANLKYLIVFARKTTNNGASLLEWSTHHIEEADHIFIGDEPAIEQKKLQLIRRSLHIRGRYFMYDPMEDGFNIEPCLCTDLAYLCIL